MPNIISHISRLLGNIPSPKFIEVGIHQGEHTEEILGLLNKPIYVGFEPDPRNYIVCLEKKLQDKILLFNFALSSAPGKGTLHLSSREGENWCGSSSLKAPKEHLQHFPWCKFDETTEVVVTTLDSVLTGLGILAPDFIWIDVQGNEFEVLKGATNILKGTKYLYFEYYENEMYEGQPKLNDILEYLGYGWKIIEQYPNDILLENKNVN